MKTLSFVRKSPSISYAYECEDLNPSGENAIYISPNTVRSHPEEKHILEPILNKTSGFRIKNYPKNIDDLINDVQNAGIGENAVGISEDAIFIGLIFNKDLTLSLTYKIADFDTIGRPDEEYKDFSGINKVSMLKTLREFFTFCVDASEYKINIEDKLAHLSSAV